MKRISLMILVVLCLSAASFSQNVDDALRYSQIFWGGTARFQSMGGAFTALGGDMSTLSQNPAGIGVFRSSEIMFSPQLFHIKSKAGLFGTSNTDYLYNFNLGQAGFVSNLISNESGLISLNVGYSFNKTNNLNQSVRMQGISTSGSIADFWAADNTERDINFHNLSGPAGIAFDAWVIDTLRGFNGSGYGSAYEDYGDAAPVYGQRMRRLVTNEGYTGEHALSIGGNYENKIYFGATIGINKIRFSSHFEHLESTDQALPSELEDFTYVDHYENTGTGYSIKAGAIFRPVESLRIGIAFHSPTWYRIDEYFYQDVSSHFTTAGHFEEHNEPMRFNYALATPFRLLAGVGLQIKKIALLSADYEFVDYSTARFSNTEDDYDYTGKNDEIKNILKASHNFRLGGELRLNNLYLRSGYGYYGKAFNTGDANDNLAYNSISFGIGFREKKVSVDFGYTNFMYDQKYILYPGMEGYNYDPAVSNLNTSRNMFTVSIGYKLGY